MMILEALAVHCEASQVELAEAALVPEDLQPDTTLLKLCEFASQMAVSVSGVPVPTKIVVDANTLESVRDHFYAHKEVHRVCARVYAALAQAHCAMSGFDSRGDPISGAPDDHRILAMRKLADVQAHFTVRQALDAATAAAVVDPGGVIDVDVDP